jgi:hypothetical protein
VVAEGEPLNLGEEFVAEIEGHILAQLLGQKGLGEGKGPTCNGEDQDQHHGPKNDKLGRVEQPIELSRVDAGVDHGLGLILKGQRRHLLCSHAANDGVQNVLDHLRHHQLRAQADDQRADGNEGRASIVVQIGDGTSQILETAALPTRSLAVWNCCHTNSP